MIIEKLKKRFKDLYKKLNTRTGCIFIGVILGVFNWLYFSFSDVFWYGRDIFTALLMYDGVILAWIFGWWILAIFKYPRPRNEEYVA